MFQSFEGGLWLQPSLLWQTQCAVIEADGAVCVVDPGFFPHEIHEAQGLAARVGGPGARRLLVLSHSDFDHIVGVPYFEGFETVASARWDRSNARRARRARRALQLFDGGHYIARDRPLMTTVRPDRLIQADGEEIAGCRFFLLAGHTRDGLGCFHPGSGALIVGDYLSDCEFPFIYVSALAYRETLDKLRRLVAQLSPRLLVSQHGAPAMGDREIARRLLESSGYLERLLDAAAGATDARALAQATLGAWRQGVPDPIMHYHRRNARIAWRELHR